MIKNPELLNAAQDAVFANKSYWPKDGETFCNLATNDVLERLGYASLKGMSADQMYRFISLSLDWLIKPMGDCAKLVADGTIMVGILPSDRLGQSHGHVNTLTPGAEDYSGYWNAKTPLCMNLGRVGTCFRAKGENWAFKIRPEFYALKDTL